MKSGELPINGGEPVGTEILPYGRHSIEKEDIAAVLEVLRSGWLTTGPKDPEFEEALAKKALEEWLCPPPTTS